MRALALLLLACSGSPVSAPGISLTCRYAPDRWFNVSDRVFEADSCVKVEAFDGARVAVAGEPGDECPDETRTCAIGGHGERVLIYKPQDSFIGSRSLETGGHCADLVCP